MNTSVNSPVVRKLVTFIMLGQLMVVYFGGSKLDGFYIPEIIVAVYVWARQGEDVSRCIDQCDSIAEKEASLGSSCQVSGQLSELDEILC